MNVYYQRYKRQYWIDTNGKIHNWKGAPKRAKEIISFHYEIAHKLYPDAKHPDDVLYSLGWIAVGVTSYGTIIKKEPTQAQINTCFDLGIDIQNLAQNSK